MRMFSEEHRANLSKALKGKTRSKSTKEKLRVFNTTHGMSGSREFSSWMSMRRRCYYEKAPNFCRYGARGIKVCDRWLNSFENFYEDLGVRPENMTLDRIDNNGNYEPSNCKWSTASEQRNNQTSINQSKSSNIKRSISMKKYWANK